MADIIFLVVVLALAVGGFLAMRRAGWLEDGDSRDDRDVETARAAGRAEDGRSSQLGPFT